MPVGVGGRPTRRARRRSPPRQSPPERAARRTNRHGEEDDDGVRSPRTTRPRAVLGVRDRDRRGQCRRASRADRRLAAPIRPPTSYRAQYHFTVPDHWKNDPQRPGLRRREVPLLLPVQRRLRRRSVGELRHGVAAGDHATTASCSPIRASPHRRRRTRTTTCGRARRSSTPRTRRDSARVRW